MNAPRLARSGRQRAGARPALLIDHFLIADGWALTAPAMAVLYLIALLHRWALPNLAGVAAAAAAVLLVAAAPLFVRFERVPGRGLVWRYAAMGLVVGLPLGLFGAAITALHRLDGGAHGEIYLGILVITGIVAAIALGNRLPSLVVAETALWTGTAASEASWQSLLLLVMGCIFGLGAAIRQSKLDRVAEARQREIERTLLRAEEILGDYEQSGQGWFWETDRRGALTYLSPTISQQRGGEPGALLGQPFIDLFILDAAEQVGERTLLFHLNARTSFQELAVRAALSDKERWWSISGRPIYDGFANFLGFRGSGSDLTEKRESQLQASRLAHVDSLTGLANRFQISQTLEKILTAPHEGHRACAVFLIDLDRFKHVNDTMGHPAGDALLKQVAQRIYAAVGDLGQVGRMGGDEFEVLLPGVQPLDTLGDLAARIIATLSQPYLVDGSRVTISASIGIARAPDDGVTSEAIIRNADLALYAAKDRGRGCHHFYTADLHSDAEERRQLEQDLRDALASGGLELFYQPVVRLAGEQVTGFEALLRWNHPRKGRIAPGRFIPIAEDTGLIAPIGEWALRTACHDLALWPEAVRVAVNVSPLQFANPALPAIVTSALAAAGVAPDRLELEITESVFLNDDPGTEAMFAALKRVGVRLVLDDFGTGYSSLGYLKRAPFDKIKIDQSFVRGATQPGSRNGAIIASIVSLAEALEMETTAEGVETLDELDLVRRLGCSHVQGYIYSKPVELAQATGYATDERQVAADGPRSARAARRTMLRKVTLEYGGQHYHATVRNLSETGAMLEGLWDVPRGLSLQLLLAENVSVAATVRWSHAGETGIEFGEALRIDAAMAPFSPSPPIELPAMPDGRRKARG
ncbi:MAG: EAL domain-containing protein [Sphingomonadales bacterium]|nr:EAL domain-containing protein [Sphingomonadales bacterium]